MLSLTLGGRSDTVLGIAHLSHSNLGTDCGNGGHGSTDPLNSVSG